MAKFESSVNSEYSKTGFENVTGSTVFESSVNSDYSKTQSKGKKSKVKV